MTIMLLVFSLAAAPSARSTTRKAGADRAAVRAAVGALTKELSAGELRVNPTYFKDQPSAEITDEAILDQLLAPVGNPRHAAYVRWQLLSGLSEEPEAKTVAQLRLAYRNAPPPMARPGIAVGEQQKLDQLLRGKTLSEEAEVKRQVELIFDAAARENQPILAYRDELYRRLPRDLETFALALNDLWVRMNAVADGKELVKAFAKDVQEWAAASSPPPSQLVALAEAVRKLADSKGPYYYGSASWRDYTRSFAFTRTRSGIDSGKTLKELAGFLEEVARTPALTLEK